MALAEYKRKRDFSRTSEPRAKLAARQGWSYVIQKHDATRLHYDFRLELDGVLKSWAVPKGPSLDPTVKRLAVLVEDHPVEYGDFEGVIPKGEYGGGTVLLWDQGTWEPIGDPDTSFRSGKLKFKLAGEKLKGGWILVKSSSARSSAAGKEWLLMKERDEFARDAAVDDILDNEPLSVVSGRDLDEIAAKQDRVWSSMREAGTKANRKGHARHSTKIARPLLAHRRRCPDVASLHGAKDAALPMKLKVELATMTSEVPQGDLWLHEIKFDGYRMLCRIDGDDVRFISRNQQNWTSRVGSLVPDVQRLGIEQGMLDGEVVVMQPDGTTDFQALQNALRESRLNDLRYCAFDLIHLNGQSLIDVPLEDRKKALSQLLNPQPQGGRILYSDHLTGTGPEFARQVCRMQLEGIISKRRDRPYRGGRTLDWLKIKCLKHEEFVIGGFTEPTGSRIGFGALLVGQFDDQGQLEYAGKVGTGFDQKTLKSLLRKLTPLEQKSSPFANVSRRTGPAHTAHWVKPTFVAQIRYGSKTRDGRLRHAAFQGLREDKPAREVSSEKAVPISSVIRQTTNSQKATVRDAGVDRNGSPGIVRQPASALVGKSGEFQGVRITSPEKLLYPDDNISKFDLANYYHEIADWILPHVTDRPLALLRCPDGNRKECFFQKHPGVGAPGTLRQVSILEKNGPAKYVVIDDVTGLISVAQFGALEIHAWGSRADNPEKPDRLVFDLDPDPAVPWTRVVASAHQVRDFLHELDLESFVKTTGGKGLHIVVPIVRRHAWNEAKAFCKLVAAMIAEAAPAHYTANLSKAARVNKIFVDYLRNGRGATAVVPYSTRAHAGATVSVPLTWKELTPEITSDQFSLRNVPQRLASLRKDPWEGISDVRQGLARPLKKLSSFKRT